MRKVATRVPPKYRKPRQTKRLRELDADCSPQPNHVRDKRAADRGVVGPSPRGPLSPVGGTLLEGHLTNARAPAQLSALTTRAHD